MAHVHEQFDESIWIKRYPLGELRAEAREFVLNRRKEMPDEYTGEADVERHVEIMMPSWDRVVSPRSVAANVQLRWEAWPEDIPRGSVATDVFVWKEGISQRREVSNIGGMPYWPADWEWPSTDEPMCFVGQFCFEDSRDLIGSLPGDLLLVFLKNDRDDYQTSDQFHFEWVSKTEQELITTIPRVAWWNNGPVHAQVFRTWDHPEFGIWEATKIAGIPKRVQDSLELHGTYIATLQSLGFPIEKPFPLVNREAPLTWGESDRFWGFGDVGTLYLLMGDAGRIYAEDACY